MFRLIIGKTKEDVLEHFPNAILFNPEIHPNQVRKYKKTLDGDYWTMSPLVVDSFESFKEIYIISDGEWFELTELPEWNEILERINTGIQTISDALLSLGVW